jgi:hypothetical protein
MSTRAQDADRELLHTRRITIQGFRRKDGLYDIEGHLIDTKTHDRASHGVAVTAGEPIHEMTLCITIGVDLVIRDTHAYSHTVPYPGHCESITPKYTQLNGMKLAPGFMRDIRRMFGATQGCTHLTELIGTVATAAFQTMSDQIMATTETRPFHLDGCHAMRTDGEVVRAFHPRWMRVQD